METSAAIAVSQAAVIYDAAALAVATTAAYFGYEIAAEQFRQNCHPIINQETKTSSPPYGSLQSLREALQSLRGETNDLELFKDALVEGYWIGCNSFFKSLAKDSQKNKGIPNKKNSNSNRPKKQRDQKPNPKPNDNLDKLPLLVEGARKLVEDEPKFETLAEEIINRASNLNSASNVNNLYLAAKDIAEIAKIRIEGLGKIIEHDPYHHGGTLKNGVITGLHILSNLKEFIARGLIDINFKAESTFHSVDKFRVINWKPIGEAFVNSAYRTSVVFTGTTKEYVELIKLAVSKIDWVAAKEWALSNPNRTQHLLIKINDNLQICFRHFNFAKGTVSSIYPALTKLGIAIGAFFWGSDSEASQEQITGPIEFDFPASLLCNDNPEKGPEKIERYTESRIPQLTENTTQEELRAIIASTPLSLDDIEDVLISAPEAEPVIQSKPELWEQIKYPSFLKQLEGKQKVMQDYGAHLEK